MMIDLSVDDLTSLEQFADGLNLPVRAEHRDSTGTMLLVDADGVVMADLQSGVGLECPFDDYLVAIMNAGPALIAELRRWRGCEKHEDCLANRELARACLAKHAKDA